MAQRITYDQLGKYKNKILNKQLCEFRKVHSTQHALLLQRWKKEVDNSELVDTILMDLSKGY